MNRLENEIAFVIGASRGIGRAIATACALAGAKVVISSRNIEACDNVVKEIESFNGDAVAMECDIGDRDSVEMFIKTSVAHYGAPTILICNAAINTHFGVSAAVTDEAITKMFRANILSNFWFVNQFAPCMVQNGGGSIVLISSIGERFGSKKIGPYNMTKAALSQMVRNFAVELGKENIRVNAVAPGLIKTDMSRALWDSAPTRELVEKNTPLGRIGKPEEVAGAALFLASDCASYVTGQTLFVDGGLTIAELV